MNLIYLALLCGIIATSFVYKSEARLHTESIVGGTNSVEDQYAYSVSVQINHDHYCGGGILNNRYILTAAHPFIDSNNRFRNAEFNVVAGVIYAHNYEEQYRVKREVAKIYVPRAYFAIELPNSPRRMPADIAVLEGDSGSPLVIDNTIIGVVSTSPFGCREDLQPAVYTRVTSFIPFITAAMNGERTATMRLAKYEIIACGRGCNHKVLVEQ